LPSSLPNDMLQIMRDDARDIVDVRRAEVAIQKAIQERDQDALEERLSEGFLHLDATGNRQGRLEFLRSVLDSPLEILDINSDPLTVELIGEVAVALGVQRSLVKLEDDRRVESRTTFTDIFTRRDGQWVLHLAHSLDLGASSLASLGLGETPM